MRNTPPKPLCWLLVLVLIFEWGGIFAWPSRSQAAQPVSLALPSAAELAKAGAFTPQMPSRPSVSPDELVARSEALSKAIPRVRYDPAARAQALGPGVDPAFRFVRDQIRYEAYPGVLRGAQGTYAARAGNAFDRSLLLADLLERKGLKIRFAMGRLPRPPAERLFARIFDPAPPLEADAVGKAAAFGQAEAEAFMARLRARAVRDYAAIRKALGNALPSKATPPRDEVLREIEAHVWVQVEQNGRWVDLDTAFPDATPGRTYATADRTSEALPKGVDQRITVRITSEALTGGSLKTEIALEFSALAEELLDRQIFVTHAPGGGGGLGGAIAGATLGPDTWVPMLWVDGETHPGKPISFGDQTAGERGRPPGGGLGGLFGAGGALAPSRYFAAEWLEFEIVFPDGGREVTRRALVDRAGMVWRQAGNLDPARLRPLARDAQGLLAPRDLHNIWFTAGRHNLAEFADAVSFFPQWASAVGKTPRGDLDFGQMVWPLAMQAFSFLIRSDHLIVPALNDSPSHRFYADSPRILIVSVGLDPRPAGENQYYLYYDLRRDRLRGLAREGSAERGVVERKLWFGVLEGALEHETGVQYAMGTGVDASGVASTSGLLTAEGAVVFRPGAAAREGAGAVSPETTARIAYALGSGAVLVVPRAALRGGLTGWWEIARQGADTRAVLGDDLNAVVIKGPPGRSPTWEPTSRTTHTIDSRGNRLVPKQPPDKCKKGGPEYVGVIRCVVIPLLPVLLAFAFVLGAAIYMWHGWQEIVANGPHY